MQTSLSKFLNTVFKYVTLFAISFVWTNFYFKPLWVAVLLSALISILVGLIFAYISNRKQTSIKLKNAERKQVEECSFQFLLSDAKSKQNFFVNMLKEKYEVEIVKNNILVKNGEKETLFIPIYSTTIISTAEIISAYVTAREMGLKNIVIVCKNASEDSLLFTQNIKDVSISVLDETQTFKLLLQPNNTYPNFSIEPKKVEKLRYSEIKKIAFNKSKTKGYFFSGLTLLFASLFTRYNIYYIVMASLLFLFALYCTLSNTNKTIEKKDMF